MAITVRPSVPPSHASESEHRRQLASVLNLLNQTTPDYSETEAERAAGVSIISHAYPPGDPRRIKRLENGEITINIPSDVPTLQQAVDLFPSKVADAVTVLNIESGHQPASGVAVTSGDYGHIVIRSEDGQVTVAPGFGTTYFVQSRNARAPVLDCLVDMDRLGVRGYEMLAGSVGRVESGAGIINVAPLGNTSAACLYVNASRVSLGSNTQWTGSGFIGIWATRTGVIHGESAVMDGADERGLYASRQSIVDIDQGSAKNCGVFGVRVLRSRVMAHSVDVSGAGTDGFSVGHGSVVTAASAVANNCGRYGVDVFQGSIVNFHQGEATQNGTRDLNLSPAGGIIWADEATTTNSAGEPATQDTNVSAFNRITPNGIIWSRTAPADYQTYGGNPTLMGSTVAGSHSYAARGWRITRVGRRVHVQFNITLSALDGSASGNVLIGGLPEDLQVVAGSSSGSALGGVAIANNVTPPGGFLGYILTAANISGSPVIRMQYQHSDGDIRDFPISALASNSRIAGSIEYITSLTT